MKAPLLFFPCAPHPHPPPPHAPLRSLSFLFISRHSSEYFCEEGIKGVFKLRQGWKGGLPIKWGEWESRSVQKPDVELLTLLLITSLYGITTDCALGPRLQVSCTPIAPSGQNSVAAKHSEDAKTHTQDKASSLRVTAHPNHERKHFSSSRD